MEMKATINRNANVEDGKMELRLVEDAGRWRWVDEDDTDSEVSGSTIAEAYAAAEMAWDGENWDLHLEHALYATDADDGLEVRRVDDEGVIGYLPTVAADDGPYFATANIDQVIAIMAHDAFRWLDDDGDVVPV